MSPFKNDCAAVPAFAASKNAKPAPVSIRFTLKDLRLRDVLRVFLLTAMFWCSPLTEWGGHPSPLCGLTNSF